MKRQLLIFGSIFAILLISSCKKHSGYEKVKNAEIVNSDLLNCLGKGKMTELVINELSVLEDTSLFKIGMDSSMVDICWGQYSYLNVDLTSRTLIGIGYNYILANSSKNGSASVKIYKSGNSDKYIVDVFINGSSQSGILTGYGQIWFSIPKANSNSTFEFNRKNV